MILYAAADLIWATRIKSTADELDIPARPVRSLEMLSARLADETVKALIVDLETGPVGIELIAAIRRDLPAARVMAFGPHIDTAALQAARDAGAQEVMPRGVFDHGLPELLLQLHARST